MVQALQAACPFEIFNLPAFVQIKMMGSLYYTDTFPISIPTAVFVLGVTYLRSWCYPFAIIPNRNDSIIRRANHYTRIWVAGQLAAIVASPHTVSNAIQIWQHTEPGNCGSQYQGIVRTPVLTLFTAIACVFHLTSVACRVHSQYLCICVNVLIYTVSV